MILGFLSKFKISANFICIKAIKHDYTVLANISREGKWKERLIASLSLAIPSTISPGALGLSDYSKCVIAFVDEYRIGVVSDRPRFYPETESRLFEIFFGKSTYMHQ